MTLASSVNALNYFGGKALLGRHIVHLLPQKYDNLYCEPYAGMLGVLLQRNKSATEMINDINGRLVNWWRTIRDEPELFGHLLEFTPRSRDDWEWARESMDNKELSNAYRALAFHVVVDQNMMHSDNRSGLKDWTRHWQKGTRTPWKTDRVRRLAERLERVQIENGDACDILDRTAKNKEAVIYVDPPYKSADYKVYMHHDLDWDRLTEVLGKQQGYVAISGYPGEWDALEATGKWHINHIKAKQSNWNNTEGEQVARDRTEVIWTNYQIGQAKMMF